MSKSDAREKIAEEAAKHYADLHVFSSVIAIMEGSTLSPASQRAEFHLVKFCKNEIQRCLRAYDRKIAELSRLTPKDPSNV